MKRTDCFLAAAADHSANELFLHAEHCLSDSERDLEERRIVTCHLSQEVFKVVIALDVDVVLEGILLWEQLTYNCSALLLIQLDHGWLLDFR